MISPSAIHNLHWQAYLIWMCLNFSFIPLVFFWSVTPTLPVQMPRWLTDVLSSYPETNQLSLEEIDYLFIKSGNTGKKKFFSRAQPVLESLKPVAEIERDLEREGSGSESKRGGMDGASSGEHVENGDRDEKSSQDKDLD